ncbi:MAG: hypothetical protein ACREOS_13740, partial [Candidatus Dormibacteraceae bacterium]
KGTWRELPTLGQRILAVYTLSQPLFQAFLMVLWPVTLLSGLWVKLPVAAAMGSFLPLYTLVFQFLITVVGGFAFTREYGFRFPLTLPLVMAVTFLPYQWLLGISAVRAVYRQLRRDVDWEKTDHVGAHRRLETAGVTSSPGQTPLSASRFR